MDLLYIFQAGQSRVSSDSGTIPLLAIDPVRINKKILDRNEHERIL